MVRNPGNFLTAEQLPPIEVKFKTELDEGETSFQPYMRDEKGVRPWAIPGTRRSGTPDRWTGKTKYNREREL